MKIAVILPAIRQCGPVKVFENLVNELAKFTDIDLELFYLDRQVDKEVIFKIPIMQLNVRTFKFDQYDVIHTSGIRPDFIAWKHRRRIKYHISTIHNFVFSDLRYTYNWFVALFFGFFWIMIWRRADMLVCVSESLMKYYIRWISRPKLKFIHNGIRVSDQINPPVDDITEFIADARMNGLKILGTACEITRRKGLEQVIDLMSADQNYAFVIIGKGKESARLGKLIHRLGISNRCYFSGFRNSATRYFHLFDIYVVPSRSEGFCLGLIEAVQQKVPVVCSDIEVFRELFSEDEVTFFRNDDKTSIMKALKEAAGSGILKASRAFEKVKEKYSSRIMAERYCDLYLHPQG